MKNISESFYDAYDLSDVTEHIARLKLRYDDGDFIQGFGVPMVDGKKPYPYFEDNQIAEYINICHQAIDTDVEVGEILTSRQPLLKN